MDFDEIVKEVKQAVRFKEQTEVGDVILMIHEGQDEANSPAISYLHVDGFDRDPSKRDEWWFVHLTFLLIPPQPQTLILQRVHFTGREVFTMGGKKVFMQAVDFSRPDQETPEKKEEDKPRKPGLRVVKK